MKEKVSVIGIGRLGLPFSLLLASKGYDVMGCDANEEYVKFLNERTFNSDEPNVNDLLIDSRAVFTTDPIQAFNHSSLIFIFVATPSTENGDYDHQYIEQVIKKIEESEQRFKTVVIGCTVMPGYCEALQERLAVLRITVIYNPSFIAQGTICNNFKNADIVLVGGKRPILLHEIYTHIMDKVPNFKQLSLTGAEIAKISLNCFLTTKISFANRIAEVCINSGLEKEVSAVLETIGSDKRVGNECLKFGYGFSGVCLPRDNKALGLYANSVGVPSTFQDTIDSTNREHLLFLHKYFVGKNPDKNVPFVFNQLSYKKGVSILTESQPLKLCLRLLNDGYKVNIVESESVVEQAKRMLKKYENQISYNDDKTGYVINL